MNGRVHIAHVTHPRQKKVLSYVLNIRNLFFLVDYLLDLLEHSNSSEMLVGVIILVAKSRRVREVMEVVRN